MRFVRSMTRRRRRSLRPLTRRRLHAKPNDLRRKSEIKIRPVKRAARRASNGISRNEKRTARESAMATIGNDRWATGKAKPEAPQDRQGKERGSEGRTGR